jgi:hypothetical protein
MGKIENIYKVLEELPEVKDHLVDLLTGRRLLTMWMLTCLTGVGRLFNGAYCIQTI